MALGGEAVSYERGTPLGELPVRKLTDLGLSTRGQKREHSKPILHKSETGSYLRPMDFVHHSTSGVRVIKKKTKYRRIEGGHGTRGVAQNLVAACTLSVPVMRGGGGFRIYVYICTYDSIFIYVYMYIFMYTTIRVRLLKDVKERYNACELVTIHVHTLQYVYFLSPRPLLYSARRHTLHSLIGKKVSTQKSLVVKFTTRMLFSV